MNTTIQYVHRQVEAYRQYRSGRTRLSTPPVGLWLESTNRCNLRCIKCAHHFGLQRSLGDMDLDLFSHLIRQARGRVLHVSFNVCGEPLLHRGLFRMIRQAKELGIPRTFLHTNATLLTSRKSRALLESGLDHLMISFDSEIPEEYERIHVRARYRHTLTNILRLLREKKRMGRKKPEVAIKIIRVFAERSGERDPDPAFLRLFSGLPVDRIFTVRIHATGTYARELGAVEGISSEAVRFTDRRLYAPCLRPYTSLAVAWDGRAMACFQDYRMEYTAGDLTQQSLMEVWNGPGMRELRHRLHEGPQAAPPPCNRCSTTWRTRPPEPWKTHAVKSWLSLPRTLVRYHAPLLARKICGIPALNRRLGQW